MTKSILGSLILIGILPAVSAAGDLSKYRDFQLGTALPAIVKQTGVDPSLAKEIHRRPALIQELEWRAQPIGVSSQKEAVKDVVFSFYDGTLFRITVHYDRYQTEGMTTDDLVEAISTTYGPAIRPDAKVTSEQTRYHDADEVLARWEDSEYRFELVRESYGPTYQLTGLTKSVAAQASAADLEAKRLDDQEAPQRDAARMASEEESARAKSEKARLVNKPKFRP